MAQEVVIAGALFSDVPSIKVPDSNNVYHGFTDVSDTTAAAADVAQGKYFYTAAGVRTAGTSTGGGGSAIVVTDTTDPTTGGTVKTITAVDLSADTVDAAHLLQGYTAHDRTGAAVTGSYTPQPSATLVTKSITSNGTYDPADDSADGYSEVTVNVPSGIVIPSGMAYYNGYLLPQIPSISGRQYAWIRDNDQNDTYDLVLGTGVWYTKSGSATLDNWQLMFNNYATNLSYQYSIPRDGTATSWGEYITSSNYYGTNSDRKVIWSSHDIKIASAGGNVLYRHGGVLLPTA